jgi:hypothetical protein
LSDARSSSSTRHGHAGTSSKFDLRGGLLGALCIKQDFFVVFTLLCSTFLLSSRCVAVTFLFFFFFFFPTTFKSDPYGALWQGRYID